MRVSGSTKQNENINAIADMIEQGQYFPLSATFYTDPENTAIMDLSKHYFRERQDNVDRLSAFFLETEKFLIEFMQKHLPREMASFSPDTCQFVRKCPPSDREDKDTLDYQIREEDWMVTFLKDFTDHFKFEEFHLSAAKMLKSQIEDVFDAYSYMTDYREVKQDLVDEYNSDVDKMMKNQEKKYGMFVVLKTYETTDDGSTVLSEPSCFTEFAFDRDSLEQRVIREMNDDEQEGAPRFVIMGPFEYDDAVDFSDYLRIGIRINCEPNDFNTISQYCTEQNNIYKARLKDQKEGKRKSWPKIDYDNTYWELAD